MAVSIGDLFVSMEDFGFFDFVLPFLIVFALVFAILEKSKWLGDNKPVQAVISVSVGLLSIWGMMLTEVYKVIFPYMGIFLGGILVVVIFLGFFINGEADSKKYAWIAWVAAVVVLLLTLNFFGVFQFQGGYGFWDTLQDNFGVILAVIGTIVAITLVIKSK